MIQLKLVIMHGKKINPDIIQYLIEKVTQSTMLPKCLKLKYHFYQGEKVKDMRQL